MIEPHEYFTPESSLRLDKLYASLLGNKESDKDYFKTHDINEVNSEGYNLLALALREGKDDLAHLLIDQGANVNQICNRGEHLVVHATDELLLKILKSDKLTNKSLVLTHLIDYSSTLTHETRIEEILDCFDKFAPDVLIKLEIRLAAEHSTQESWTSFKKNHQIEISDKDVVSYLFKKSDKLNTYSNDPYNNKKQIKLEQATQKVLQDYLYKSEICIQSKQNFRRLWRSVKSDKRGESIQSHLNDIYNDSQAKLFDVIEDPSKYRDYFSHIIGSYQAPIKDHTDLRPLLKKYGLKSISISKDFNPKTVYQLLDQQLTVLAQTFQVTAENLGGNELNLCLYNHDKNCGFKGKYIRYGKGEKGEAVAKIIKMYASDGIAYMLARNLPEVLLNNKQEVKYFSSTLIHEYTHFLQFEYGKNIFQKTTVNKHWTEITKNFTQHQTAEQCIDYLESRANSNNKEFKKLLTICFGKFNTRIQQDKQYIKAIGNLKNFVEKKMPYDFMSLCSLVITAYQKKSSFQEDVWQQFDKKKIYISDPYEIHARLCQEILSEIDTKKSALQPFKYLNPIEEPSSYRAKIKPKLVAFNQLLINNLIKKQKAHQRVI